MRNFLKNCREAFSEEDYGKEDSGAMINTVFTVFFVGAFAVISILAVSWIGNAILWNAQTPAQCLADSNNINGNRATNPDLVCIGATNEKAAEGSAIIKNQIQNSKGNRF